MKELEDKNKNSTTNQITNSFGKKKNKSMKNRKQKTN